MFPDWTVLKSFMDCWVGKSFHMGCFISWSFKGISRPWFPVFTVRKSDTQGCWDRRALSHLLWFWQWYLLSEIWGLACHVFSQNTDGSWPTSLVLVFFFFHLHKIACFSLQMGVWGSSEVGFFPCCTHTICGLLASLTSSQIVHGVSWSARSMLRILAQLALFVPRPGAVISSAERSCCGPDFCFK